MESIVRVQFTEWKFMTFIIIEHKRGSQSQGTQSILSALGSSVRYGESGKGSCNDGNYPRCICYGLALRTEESRQCVRLPNVWVEHYSSDRKCLHSKDGVR